LLNTPPERNSQLASIPDTPALNQLERVALALFKASLQLEQAGWGAVAQLWQHGMALAASLPMAPLRQLLNYHQPLVAAAAQQKQLRSDLLGLIQTPIRRPRWQIQALGTFNCLRDGKNCELSPIHRALLIRLLDAGPSGISYEALWESVWGDLLVSRSALDSALSRLRTITELNISTKSGICAIRNAWEDLTYDVQQIEQLLSQSLAPSDLPNIIDLYQGQFFPGAPLSATIWVEARRAQLQQQTLNTLDRLAQQLEHTAPAEAITCYQHILRIDGCREHTAMQLMRLADQHGNRRLVVDTFEQLREALRSLNVAPQASTTAFYRNLI
jgi:DNA-binding SARP family transcriptional activator